MTYTPTAEQQREWELYDQVRRLRVHDDIRGGYVDAVIGWWDGLGYTYCPACLPADAPDPFPVESGNSAANGNRCDVCHVSLHEAALADPARLVGITSVRSPA